MRNIDAIICKLEPVSTIVTNNKLEVAREEKQKKRSEKKAESRSYNYKTVQSQRRNKFIE